MINGINGKPQFIVSLIIDKMVATNKHFDRLGTKITLSGVTDKGVQEIDTISGKLSRSYVKELYIDPFLFQELYAIKLSWPDGADCKISAFRLTNDSQIVFNMCDAKGIDNNTVVKLK